MDIPVASTFNELQGIFDHLKQSDEPKIHGIYLFYCCYITIIFIVLLIFL
jgi:hypothetical protein